MTGQGLMEGFCERLRAYLAELEQRLFSAGLHTLGQPPSAEDMQSYLTAYFEDGAWAPAGVAAAVDAAAVGGPAAEAEADAAEQRRLGRIEDVVQQTEQERRRPLEGRSGPIPPPSPGRIIPPPPGPR